MASPSSPMDAYLERHRKLVLQAEELATTARREAKGMPSVLPGQAVDTRKSAYALTARRKLMEMSKVIASIERLSQQHLRAGDTVMKRRVADDLAALQLRQREALNDVTAAAAAPSAYKPVRGEETRATRPLSNQELVQSQLQGIDQQEQVLDRIGQSVGRVHNQATTLHGEVRSQIDLVQSLDYDVESVQGRVVFARDKVAEVFKRMDKKLFYLFCFLGSFLLTYLTVMILKRLL